MKTVIYVNGLGRYPDRQLCSSIKTFGAKAGWNVQSVQHLKSSAMIKKLKDLWNPSGFIVNCGAGLNPMPISSFGEVPTVFFDHPRGGARPRGNVLFHNPAKIGELAARELLSIGLKEFAFVGWIKQIGWSERRHSAFSDMISAHGRKTRFFDSASLNTNEDSIVKALAKWLARLPKPIGIFAANDIMSASVANACILSGLSIPDDVAVIGVDNDIETCENTNSTLSSIALDYFRAGQEASAKLERLMSGIKSLTENEEPTLITPAGVIRRKSTRRLARPDKAVADAMERIRREACLGISAKDVLHDFPCSRRAAEYRFRAATGHSIHDEILHIRLETAMELLRIENLNVNYVANRCGYKSLAAFSMFFKAETGTSPTSWKKRQRRTILAE